MAQVIDRKHFFDSVRKPLFGGALTDRQVSGMDAIFTEWDARQLTNLGWLADMLKTVYRETGKRMYPSPEIGGEDAAYAPYYGRDFVHTTHKDNYAKFEKIVGVPLVAQPARIAELDVATTVMFEGMLNGMFTGKALKHFDYQSDASIRKARSIINGDNRYPASKGSGFVDLGAELVWVFKQFRAALRFMEYVVQEPTEAPMDEPVIFTEPDFSEHPKYAPEPVNAGLQDVELEDFRQWRKEQQLQQFEAEYKARNTKPVLASRVTHVVLAGLSALMFTQFGVELPPETQQIIEFGITAAMGAGAVYFRKIATTFIR